MPLTLTPPMTAASADETGLRTLYQLGGDWLWFFLAVLAGLALAAWLAGIALDAHQIAPAVRG